MGKTKHFTVRIEFQERGSPHIHSFIWIFNVPNIENKAAYILFIKKIINSQLSDHLNDCKLFELVKAYQVHAHSTTYGKYNKNECHYGRYFTEKTIIAKPLNSNFSNDEKQDFKMEKYITKVSQNLC